MTRRRPTFRSLLATERPLIMPGAHDVISARLIEDGGFKALTLGGLALLAAQRGLPDIGLAALSDMVEAARAIVEAIDIPCLIDGDDGYGDVKSVARTVRAYERLRAGAVIFEDQDIRTKRSGEGNASRVVEPADMVHKIKVAIATRDDPDFLVVARTDAFMIEGLDGALRRADAYLKAGADAIFVSGIGDPADMARLGARLKGAIQLATVTERLLHVLPSPADLYSMGFAIVGYPHFLTTRMTAAGQAALDDLAALSDGRTEPRAIPQRLAASDMLQTITRLPDWLALERGAG